MKKLASFFALALTSSLFAACGAGELTKAALPDGETAAGAVGDPKCTPQMIANGSSPLIVDWDPSRRSDLEVAMKEGVVVASYSCEKGVQLLPDCKVAGDYGYVGVSTKSQKVTLSSSDDIGANLSVGSALPIELKAALSRGSALHLGYMLVGKRSAARPFVAKQELEGRCDGATHFVRRADVGAFAFKSGAKADFESALSVFQQGIKGSSQTEKDVSSTDGKPDACEKANPDAADPPSDCRAVVRVTLLPIDDKPLKEVAQQKAETPAKKSMPVDEPVCPEGTVLSAGKCQLEQKEMSAYLCAPNDEAECKAQCQAGDDGSCGRYANLLLAGGDDRMNEAKPLVSALTRACEKSDVAVACGVSGWLTDDNAKSLALHTQGCRQGYVHSCMELGDFLLQGHRGATKDPARYFSVMDAACQAGSAMACALLADHHLGGKDTARDVAKGKQLALRACHGGTFIGCLFYGAVHLGKEDCEKAAGGKTLHCDAADGSNPAEGKKFLARACELSDEACAASKALEE